MKPLSSLEAGKLILDQSRMNKIFSPGRLSRTHGESGAENSGVIDILRAILRALMGSPKFRKIMAG